VNTTGASVALANSTHCAASARCSVVITPEAWGKRSARYSRMAPLSN
jgi:hypothetical protein